MQMLESRSAALPRVFGMLVVILSALAGVALLVYPLAMSHWNNNKQLELAQLFEENNQNTQPAILQKQLDSAHEYNRLNTGGPLSDPWLSRVSESSDNYRAYLSELSGQSVMARLVIPAIDVDLPVYHGTTERTLAKGIGHLFGSQLPVGGPGTHALLTGHTGIPEATLFDNLDQLEIGDAFYISVAGEHLKYEVSERDVVLPNETETLGPVVGEDLVTLITCTPYGINTHRLLVTGHRVEMDPAQEIESVTRVWTWWMYTLVAVVALLILLILLFGRRVFLNQKATAETDLQEESS